MLQRPITLLALCTLWFLAPAARGQVVVHVDATLGVDVAGAGSPRAPYRTLTFALSQQPDVPPPTEIRVARGTYDAALGEQFPIPMRPLVSIVGEGPGRTRLAVPAGANGIRFLTATDAQQPGAPWVQFFPTTRLAGLTVESEAGGAGVALAAEPFTTCSPSLCDLRVTGFERGLDLFGQGLVELAPRMEHIELRRCDRGVSARQLLLPIGGDFPGPTLREALIEDCRVGYAARTDVGLDAPVVTHALERVAIRGCGVGVEAGSFQVELRLRLEDCLVASCRAGLALENNAGGPLARFLVARSTVAACELGIRGVAGEPGGFDLDHTILWGNGAAAAGIGDPGAQLATRWCDLQPDWPAPLAPTDLSVDPHFVQAQGPDLRLAADSPLVDAGDPTVGGGGLDLFAQPRVLDGDGDLAPRLDLGALEHDPVTLALGGAAVLGGTLEVELGAPAGWVGRTAWSTGTADVDLGPLGALLLDPTGLTLLPPGAVPLPLDPALRGVELWLQGAGLDPLGGAGATSRRVRLVLW